MGVLADSSPKPYGPSLPAGQPAAQLASQHLSRPASVGYSSNPGYSYAYSVKDPYSGVDIDAQEDRLGYQTRGSYGTSLPDGRRQSVNYIVDDDSGYQADVQYYGVAQHPRSPVNSYGRGFSYRRGSRFNVNQLNGINSANRGIISLGETINPGLQTSVVPNLPQSIFTNSGFRPAVTSSVPFNRGLGNSVFSRRSNFGRNQVDRFGFRAPIYEGYSTGFNRFVGSPFYRRSLLMRSGYYL